MTIREEYLEAKQNLRMANVMNDYDNEAHFVVAFEHTSKKAQTMLRKLLEADANNNNWKMAHGFRSESRFIKEVKILRDLENSINSMVII